jgi:NAD(P)-dependent dehydrogenase (short-subunit alcohol dehydrogenase family)
MRSRGHPDAITRNRIHSDRVALTPTDPPREHGVVIVTCGSRGTGLDVARRLADAGYAVVIGYADDQDAAEAAVEQILATDGTAIAIRGDIDDELDVERLFAETTEAFGGVDVVVHTAGQLMLGPVASYDIGSADALARPDVRGTFLVRREATRELRDGGLIVAFAGHWVRGRPADVARLFATDGMKSEVVVVPVSDVDRAKDFYRNLGWQLDTDFANTEDFRVVQLTPPGSRASVIFGTAITAAVPGSADSLVLAVYDIDATRGELIGRGIDVRQSSSPSASFRDPDGNGWLLQEINTRPTGR